MVLIEVKKFMLDPSSGVKLTSNTVFFVNLPYTNIYASRSQYLNRQGPSTTVRHSNTIFVILQLPRVCDSEVDPVPKRDEG